MKPNGFQNVFLRPYIWKQLAISVKGDALHYLNGGSQQTKLKPLPTLFSGLSNPNEQQRISPLFHRRAKKESPDAFQGSYRSQNYLNDWDGCYSPPRIPLPINGRLTAESSR